MSTEKLKSQTCESIDEIGDTLKKSSKDIIIVLAEQACDYVCLLFDKAISKTKEKMACNEEVSCDGESKDR
jgi:hypothetical protein